MLRVSEWIQPPDSSVTSDDPNDLVPHALGSQLTLVLVFQVNCPGCLIEAVPIMQHLSALSADRTDAALRLLGISTCFEAAEFNTAQATRALCEEQRVFGDSLQACLQLHERRKQRGAFPWEDDDGELDVNADLVVGDDGGASVPWLPRLGFPVAFDELVARGDDDEVLLEDAEAALDAMAEAMGRPLALPPRQKAMMVQKMAAELAKRPRATTFDSFRGIGTPLFLLLDAKGQVVFKHTGPNGAGELLAGEILSRLVE